MEDSEQKIESTQCAAPSTPTSKLSRNVAILSSSIKWKARIPTPHPKKGVKTVEQNSDSEETKAEDKEKQEKCEPKDGTINMGYEDEKNDETTSSTSQEKEFSAVTCESPAGGEPVLQDEERKPRVDKCYVALAVMFCLTLLGGLIYIAVYNLHPALSEIPNNNITIGVNTTESLMDATYIASTESPNVTSI